ncbi:MAG: hypothetical protein ACRDQ5_22080 [Sciscionella sp.]
MRQRGGVWVMRLWLLYASGKAPSIPDPGPRRPPGAEKILEVVGYVRWVAGLSLIVGFLVGLIVWAGGRWVDHHRAGRIGLIMMLCALAGGIFYGIGHQVIVSFAGAG